MANYRANDVIRLTRKAVGLSQEAISEGICSVETKVLFGFYRVSLLTLAIRVYVTYFVQLRIAKVNQTQQPR